MKCQMCKTEHNPNQTSITNSGDPSTAVLFAAAAGLGISRHSRPASLLKEAVPTNGDIPVLRLSIGRGSRKVYGSHALDRALNHFSACG